LTMSADGGWPSYLLLRALEIVRVVVIVHILHLMPKHSLHSPSERACLHSLSKTFGGT